MKTSPGSLLKPPISTNSLQILQPQFETLSNPYLESHNQLNPHSVESMLVSELSELICIGPVPIKKSNNRDQLIDVMENVCKKQYELEIEQCREIQGLILLGTILEEEKNMCGRIRQLENEIRLMRKLIHEGSEISGANSQEEESESGKEETYIMNSFTQNLTTNKPIYNIIKAVEGRIIIKKDHQNYCNNTRLRPEVCSNKETKLSPSNLSTIQSTCSNMTEGKRRNGEIDRKIVLMERIKFMEEQMMLKKIEKQREEDMLIKEIRLLKKETLIMQDLIHQSRFHQRGSLTPNPKTRPKITSDNIYRNPRFTTRDVEERQTSKSPNLLLINKNKFLRPSIFRQPKVNSYSPQPQPTFKNCKSSCSKFFNKAPKTQYSQFNYQATKLTSGKDEYFSNKNKNKNHMYYRNGIAKNTQF